MTQQQVDDPPSLPVGTEVSAKYKGAFCEAKVRKVVRNIKVKVAYKQGLGSGIVSDDAIKSGVLRVGAVVEVKHPDKREYVEATITKIQDCSQYTVVFDDGDITTLRRTALCLKSGRHFNESETLDQLPLTHPEHFGNPVIGGRRGRRSRHLQEESSDDDDENDSKEVVNEKEEHIGKIVCVESTETKKKDKEKWFPGLVVSPTAQVTVRIRVKDEYLVRSFKDGRYYTVPKKEATEFTRELAAKQDGPAVQAALEYLDNDILPPHWDRDALFGLTNSSSEYEGEVDSDSSDDEPREEKDHFVAQLYKYMDDRGTPLNKVPSITNRDVDLYRLFRAVQKLGGYNRVTSQNQWKAITMRLGFTPVTVSVTNLVKQAYKKFLQPFEEFNRKLGCSMSMTPRNASRSKGRSLVRANSVASPKPEVKEKEPKSNQNQVIVEDSENTNESSNMEAAKSKRKLSTSSNKIKNLVEKFEEKNKDEPETHQITSPAKITKQVAKDDTGQAPVQTPISNKKEKIGVKKNASGTEEKRGRKKKEVVEAEKQAAEKVIETPTVNPIADFPVEVGDKLKVYYHEKTVTYEAKVIDLSIQQGNSVYLVHYTGWNTRYDEWVPKERIAENITNNKTKRSKGGGAAANSQKQINTNSMPIAEGVRPTSSEKLGPSNISLSMGLARGGTTSKRGRGRSDSQASRSTTPISSVITSRTKSPAVSIAQRRTTRAQPNTAVSRRTSNNVSDISMQTDSDTDSDEPVKKPTKSTTSSNASGGSTSSTQATAGSVKATTDDTKSASSTALNSPSETEEDDIPIGTSGAKGRDYDLNQIRSELKGINELKSPSPEGDTIVTPQLATTTTEKNQPSVFNFSGVVENNDLKQTSPTKILPSTISSAADLKSSSTDLSSETDSFADDDSQSSDKTTTLENMTEKLQQKIKAEKLAQAKCLERISASGGKNVEKITPLKSAGLEKIIKESLAEKMQETLKATTKPFLIEKSIYKIPAPVISSEKEEKPKPIFEIKVQPGKPITTITKLPSLPLITPEKKVPAPLLETKSPPIRCIEKKIVPITEKAPQITIKAAQKEPAQSTPETSSVYQHSSQTSSSILEKNSKDISKSSPLISPVKPAPVVATDVYEFKEPEPFEFEGRKPISIAHTASEASESKKKKNSQKIESTHETTIKNIGGSLTTPTPTTTTTVGRKSKKSPLKDSQPLSELRCAKQTKIEEKPPITPEISASSSSSLTLSPSSTVTGVTVVSTGNLSITNSIKVENPFDALRKSPSFNLNINALNEELAATVQETAKALLDVPAERIIPVTLAAPAQKAMPAFISPFVESKLYSADVANVFEMKSDDESTKSDQNDDQNTGKKIEFETVKKILLSDASFDLEPPKIEKPSIADKVLKALNQQKQEEKFKETTPLINPVAISSSASSSLLSSSLVVASTSTQSLTEPTTSRSEQALTTSVIEMPQKSSFIISEPPKIELPVVIKKDIDIPIKKPILSSPEHKLDILESIAPKNNDLSETIQKLESVIQKTSNVDHFDDDSSDSTDSERRLVIEDNSQDSDNQAEMNKIVTLPSSVATNVITTTAIASMSMTSIVTNNELLQVKEEKPTITSMITPITILKQDIPINVEDMQKNTTNFPTKFQSSIFGMKSIVFADSSILSDAGIKPIVDTSPVKIDVSNEQKPSKFELLAATETSILIANPTVSTTTNTTITAPVTVSTIMNPIKDEPITNTESLSIHSESINLLLCEETIPGSPTPIRETSIDIKPNLHPIEADIKPIPMDIECSPIPCSNSTDVTMMTSAIIAAATGSSVASSTAATTLSTITTTSMKTIKTSGGNVSSGRIGSIGAAGDNQTPGSSPRDSVSQDDSSEDLKKQIEHENETVKKRRRTRKHSDCESTFSTKRRRAANVSNQTTKRNNGSDSEDNSDANISSQRLSTKTTRPCQYNFLVNLDPALNPNQRIAILRKKIQELRKTYNMIKAELASIDRRRKKLRRREREKKNLQKISS